MNLYQKIVLVLGTLALLWAVFTVPTKDIVVHNPNHLPYTEPDYNLMLLRVIGVVGATGVAYVLAKSKEETGGQ
jgi:hypothetical protein